MNAAAPGERELRERVVARAADLGAAPRPDDVLLSYAEVPAAPGYRMVRASWGAGGTENALAGLLDPGGEPDLLPGHAVETLLEVWSAGPPPTAGAVATALAFLLDPLARWEPLLDDDVAAAWAADDGPVTGPIVETDARGRVTRARFWWRRGPDAREVTVDVDASGRAGVGGGRSAAPRAEGERP